MSDLYPYKLSPGEGRHIILRTITDLRSFRAAVKALKTEGIKFTHIVLPQSIFDALKNGFDATPSPRRIDGIRVQHTNNEFRQFIYKHVYWPEEENP